jgi:hypothetical protein
MLLCCMIIRPIHAKDNVAIAKIIRDTLMEFGAAKPGTVYFDATTDHLFELFQQPKAAYFVVENDGVVLGGGGIFLQPDYLLILVSSLKCIYFLMQEEKGLEKNLSNNACLLQKKTASIPSTWKRCRN